MDKYRLARSIKDLQDIVHELKTKGITLVATEQSIDTRTAAGKAFLDMLGVFAEFETNLRRERQLEGIALAKTRGVYKGREPSIDAAEAHADRRLGHYEEDHLILLELGGSPIDPRNLRPEPNDVAGGWGSFTKDRLENALRERVCEHRITLARAGGAIARNWIAGTAAAKVTSAALPPSEPVRRADTPC